MCVCLSVCESVLNFHAWIYFSETRHNNSVPGLQDTGDIFEAWIQRSTSQKRYPAEAYTSRRRPSTEWSRKINNPQSLMHRHFATVCSRITQFYQNSQKLTDNTKNGQILNIVIKYSVSQLVGNLKSISTDNILKVAMTEEKFAKSECYKFNGRHFYPKN